MDCYIFDLDGTLADLSHRLHHIKTPGKPKDWRAFFANVLDDAPIPHIVELYHFVSRKKPVVFVSGRSDEARGDTILWLVKHNFIIHANGLYMRTAGDQRPDYLVKYDLLQQLKADGWSPVMAFDDRDQVVKMWRENGIPCAQVAQGDF